MDRPLPATPPPEWVELSHTGLTIRHGPRRQDYGWWMFLLALTLFWTGMIGAALATQDFDLTWACMTALVPFLWTLTAALGHELATRRTLTLTPTGLVIRQTLFSRFERVQRLPLRHAKIEVDVHEGGKGWTHTAVQIEISEPGTRCRTVRFQLPGGRTLRDREQVIEQAHWVVMCLHNAVAAATNAPASEADDTLRQDLSRLLTSIHDTGSRAT